MPKYQYTARNAYSKKVKGTIHALDEADLAEQLRQQDLFLLSSKEIKKKTNSKSFKAKELSEFCRQMGTLIASGVTLVRALGIMIEEEGISNHQREVFASILKMVRQGEPLSGAMEKQPDIFPRLLIHMIRTAEMSGSLDKTMMRMAEQYDKEYKLNSKVKSAMSYPKMLSVLIVAVVMLLMIYVVPQFTELFSQMETLPLPTQILLGTSDFVRANWMIILVSLVLVVFVIRIVTRIPYVELKRDQLLIHLPVFGKLEKSIYTARFARTLCSLYGSGLPIMSCLSVARKTIGNVYIDKQFDDVIAFVRGGGNLSEGLEKIDGFTKKLVSSIRIGEETGHLESMMESTADTLDYDAEIAINKMVSFLEPTMIVVMAGIVGFVMISVMTPIYGSYESMSNIQ
ncbi:MAG: type II secretion system F family protein [bacterium]|nr:type II secretion system F family protein [bacterium]